VQPPSETDVVALRNAATQLPTKVLVNDKVHINLRTHLQERFMHADPISSYLKITNPTPAAVHAAALYVAEAHKTGLGVVDYMSDVVPTYVDAEYVASVCVACGSSLCSRG
jgi:hypothetical protein